MYHLSNVLFGGSDTENMRNLFQVYFYLAPALAVSLLVSGCFSTSSESTSDSDLQYSLREGIAVLSDLPDEMAGESYARIQTRSPFYQMARSIWIPSAWAASCSGRAVEETCETGLRTKTYADCSIGSSDYKMGGQVVLTYSNIDTCSLSATFDSVTKTYDGFKRMDPDGSSVTISSVSHRDYLEQEVGGGAELILTNGYHMLDIRGIRRTHSQNLFDLSFQSGSSIEIQNTLGRDGRVLSSGILYIRDNIKHYTITAEVSDLAYESNCCHPVGGKMTLNFEGAYKGSGSVLFRGCGDVNFKKDGQLSRLQLPSCI